MTRAAIQTATQTFCLLDLTQAPRLGEMFGLDLELADNLQLIQTILTQCQKTLSREASGVLLDPLYSFDTLTTKPSQVGTLLTLTQPAAAVDPLALPHLIPDWSVESIKENYAMASFDLYYHPEEEQALQKKQMLAEIHDFCRQEKIELMVRLFVYALPNQKNDKETYQAVQLEALQELRASMDLVVIQYPLDALACATVTAELDIPWLVMTESQEYSQAKDTIRNAVENGARGGVVGESVWKEIEGMRLPDMSPDMVAITKFLQTESRDRMIELNRIIKENAAVLG